MSETVNPQLTDRGQSSVAETHISTVWFVGERAFKLLKPVRTSFLDHSTTEKRLAAIDQELELNRRLAPDVYLGSADVTEDGDVTDRMLVMRRLPADRRLTALIDTRPFGDHVRTVARAIAVFHSALEPLYNEAAIAGRDAMWQNWRNNFDDLEPLVGNVLGASDAAEARDLVDRYLGHHRELFERRMADGFVRDGHGDLTAEDIFCLPDGPRILDCLAFDRALRVGDVLLDVAFLAMDLDRLAGPRIAAAFMSYYRELTNEHHPASLAHHYVAYRAHVRAKVAALRLQQGDPAQAELARCYHDLCLHHLRRSKLTLILVGGTPGTGKSTVANSLSGALGFMLLSSDELRKEVAGRGQLDRDLVDIDEGIYSPTMTHNTYDELLRRAARLLDRAESVVLDASWNSESGREAARALADAKGADLIELVCELGPEVAKARIARRLDAGVDPSDARPELVDELAARFDPWPSATKLDAIRSRAEMLADALSCVDAHQSLSG